ncbi:MAG: InlB B-repeat-containing protein, partial [Acholeplasmatales bacterium]|nr:InlB B-repeat-containing protein [Acholeplasmatales bacterium]
MKIKRKLIFLGLLSAVFLFAGCENKNKKEDTNPDTNKIVEEDVFYLVSFDTDGGSNIMPQSIKNGNKVTRPDDPTKTGVLGHTYTFAGWYKDRSYTEEFDFNLPITVETTIYAKWYDSINIYTIRFESNGGSIVPSVTSMYDQKITRPTDPTKQGDETIRYAFGGWYKDEGLQTAFDFENDTIKESLILYAKWNLTDKFQVTFNAMGGTPDTQTQLVFDGDTVSEPTTNPTKAEDDNFVYTFGGWYTSTDGGVTLSDTAYDFSTKVTSVLV